jgi:hypothetical protein
MTPKIKTYRAIIVGVAIILIVAIGYFIYRGIVGVKNSTSSSATVNTANINPVGSGEIIQENAPVSNQGVSGNASQYNVVPVSGSSSSSNGSSVNGSGGSTSVSGGGSGSDATGTSNPCPDYLGDQHACVQSNYTIYGTK